MGLDQFCILFDNNPQCVFFAGQTVTGRLHLSISVKPKTFRAITLKCKGFAYVHFTRQRTVTRRNSNGTDTTHTETDHYTAQEEYFSFKMPILSDPSSGGQMSLGIGQHSYPFSFILPHNIPCSFEGSHGHVRYTIKGTMDRSWKFDHDCTLGFTVNSLVDLNQNPSAQMAGSATDSKTICCCCCRSGPISARCWMIQSGYVPGQTLYFNGEVDNLTGKTMKSSTVRFKEVTSFHAQGSKEESVRIIKEMKHGPFGPSDHWTNEPIMIPSVAPSGLPYCNIIHISYRIEYIIDPGAMSFNLSLPMEVIIGSIPVRPNVTAPPPPKSYPDEYNNQQQQQHQPIMPIGFEDLPPRYEDCFFPGSADIRDDVNKKDDGDYKGVSVPFTPRYVSYLPSAPPMP